MVEATLEEATQRTAKAYGNANYVIDGDSVVISNPEERDIENEKRYTKDEILNILQN